MIDLDYTTGKLQLISDRGIDLLTGMVLKKSSGSGGGSGDSGGSGDEIPAGAIKVSGLIGDAAYMNGVYPPTDSAAAGTDRVWRNEAAAASISYHWGYMNWILKPDVTEWDINVFNAINPNAENPWDTTWMNYRGEDSIYGTPVLQYGSGSSSGGSGDSGGSDLIVSGVVDTMAAMLTPAFAYADGKYLQLDAAASGKNRVWQFSNGGYDFYFQWSATEGAWVLSESRNDPASNGFPYIYATSATDNPWDATSWEFNLTGPVSISVTKG